MKLKLYKIALAHLHLNEGVKIYAKHNYIFNR